MENRNYCHTASQKTMDTWWANRCFMICFRFVGRQFVEAVLSGDRNIRSRYYSAATRHSQSYSVCNVHTHTLLNAHSVQSAVVPTYLKADWKRRRTQWKTNASECHWTARKADYGRVMWLWLWQYGTRKLATAVPIPIPCRPFRFMFVLEIQLDSSGFTCCTACCMLCFAPSANAVKKRSSVDSWECIFHEGNDYRSRVVSLHFSKNPALLVHSESAFISNSFSVASCAYQISRNFPKFRTGFHLFILPK